MNTLEVERISRDVVDLATALMRNLPLTWEASSKLATTLVSSKIQADSLRCLAGRLEEIGELWEEKTNG